MYFNLEASTINLERFVLFVGHNFNSKISLFTEIEVEDAKVSGGEEGGEVAIEQAYLDNKISWKKPISCHLFPIKITKSKQDPDLEFVNYEPREDLCATACSLGKKLKVPAYIFLKDAIIRKYGQEFYDTLDATANRNEL